MFKSVILMAAVAALPVLAAEAQGKRLQAIAEDDLERGISRTRYIEVSPGLAGPAAGASCSTTGEQRTAVLLLSFPATPLPANITPELVRAAFFGTGSSVAAYFGEVSHGRMSVKGDVFGPFQLDSDVSCVKDEELFTAALKASSATVNAGSYDRFYLVFPNNAQCTAARGTIGCWKAAPAGAPANVSTSWFAVDASTTAAQLAAYAMHEAGHNLSLNHASTASWGAEPLGPATTPPEWNEYGDYFSAMGLTWSFSGTSVTWASGHYAAPHKAALGWLEAASGDAPGIYQIQPYEAADNPKALRIRRPGTDASLWVEYRQPTGFDSVIGLYSQSVYKGALIHYDNPTDKAHEQYTALLNFNPGSAMDTGGRPFGDAALQAGKSWTDPGSTLALRTLAATPNGLFLEVGNGPLAVCANCSLNPSVLADVPVDGYQGTVVLTAGGSWEARSSAGWLTVSPAAGSGNATLTLTAIANTSPGSRTAVISVSGTVLTVTQQGTLKVAAVTSAADGSAQVAPGSIVSIWGTGFASGVASALSIPLPVSLGETSVEVVDGGTVRNAPLFFVSGTQINAQLPFGLGPSVQVRVKAGPATSAPLTVAIQASSPRLFTTTMDGKGTASALRHPDYAVIKEDNPAKPGDVVHLWPTGLGEVDPPSAAGSGAGVSTAIAKVTATVGGEPATVLWSGLAPGMAGLNQVSIVVPAGAKPGLQPVVLKSNGQASQDKVVLPIAAK